MGGVLILLMLWTAPLGAQKRPPAPKSVPVPKAWPIGTLSVKGNRNYSEQQILAVAGLRVGQLAGPRDFEAARDRLAATGVFESIDFRFGPGADQKGYAVSFQVVEVAPLFAVRFEDLGPPQQFEELLKRTDPLFGPRIPATQQMLDRYARAIEEFLAASNRKEKVAGKVSAEPGEGPAVVFRPAASPPAVALVRFTNNEVIPTTMLQNKMNAVAVGVPYKEARFRQLLDTSIRPLYEARGRIRVSFPQIQTEKAKDVNGLLVTVKVEEGPSYTVGEIRLDSPLLPPEELKKAGDIRSGDLANFDQIHAGVARMEQRHRREGYMRVGSRLDRSLHDDRKSVDLAIHFDPGPQYSFGKLTIEGLDIHAEAAVRKLWALKEGARFNADYPDYFLERIREDSLFENLGKTRALLDQNDEARAVEVKLVFGAAPPAPRERPRREPD